MPRSNVPLIERFWSKVLITDGCWEWQGMRVARQGNPTYGLFKKADGEMVYANRLVYEMAYGPIPTELFVLHRCDNPPCVRPSHLRLGTHKDNMAEMVNKSRQAVGERNGGAKMNSEHVRLLRKQYALGGTTMAHLAKTFGIGKSQAMRIVKRQSWKHIN